MATVTKQNSQFIVFQHAPEVQVDQYNLSAQLDQVDHEHPEQRQKERLDHKRKLKIFWMGVTYISYN